ncbi:hypothetical protein J6G99_08785 [bacterium]|nr:hypothetical protein [bacterium]
MSLFVSGLKSISRLIPSKIFKTAPKVSQNALNGVYSEITKDGAKAVKVYKNGKLTESSLESISSKGIITKTKVKFGENDSFLKKVERFDKDVTHIYLKAYNYKMPNGQVVNGDYYRERFYSFINNKVVERNARGFHKNWFLSFFKDSKGVMHTEQKSHGAISWCGPDRNKSNFYM